MVRWNPHGEIKSTSPRRLFLTAVSRELSCLETFSPLLQWPEWWHLEVWLAGSLREPKFARYAEPASSFQIGWTSSGATGQLPLRIWSLSLLYWSWTGRPPLARGEWDRPGPMDHQPPAGQEERRAGRCNGADPEDTWRLDYLAKLLGQRGQLRTLGLKEEERVQLLID